MKKTVILLFIIFLNIIAASAQVMLNYGATTNISDSVFVNVKGNLQNDASGIITNKGTIILSGNFVNNSSFVSGIKSNVNLEGGLQDIGGSVSTTFNNVAVGGTDNKTISIDTKVDGKLKFTANKVIIGNNNLTLLPPATITGFGNDHFVVTNGSGFLQKRELAIGYDFIFPVGTDIDILNYKPVVLNYTGTTDTFSVRVEPGPSPIVGFTQPECVQYTYIVQEGVPGGNSATLTLGWNHNTTDEGILFKEGDAMMWQFNGSSWNSLPGTVGFVPGMNGTDREYTTQNSAITSFTGDKSRFLIKGEEETDLFVPDAFSPNDDGHNDILFVRGGGINVLLFVVYDRWGEKVFESSDILHGWDGTYKGAKATSSVYTYYVKATYYSGKYVEKKGNVTLVR